MHCSAPLVIGGLELVDYLWQCEMLRMHQGPRGLVTCDVLNANIPGMHQTLFARVTVRDSMLVRVMALNRMQLTFCIWGY